MYPKRRRHVSHSLEITPGKKFWPKHGLLKRSGWRRKEKKCNLSHNLRQETKCNEEGKERRKVEHIHEKSTGGLMRGSSIFAMAKRMSRKDL